MGNRCPLEYLEIAGLLVEIKTLDRIGKMEILLDCYLAPFNLLLVFRMAMEYFVGCLEG